MIFTQLCVNRDFRSFLHMTVIPPLASNPFKRRHVGNSVVPLLCSQVGPQMQGVWQIHMRPPAIPVCC